jgi:hypothetical protein
MYYIYHIKGKKIGVSEKPKERTREQGYTEYEILEEFTCIYLVSYREIALQKEYGYPVDTILYWKTRKLNVHKGGQTAVESGQLDSIRLMGNKAYAEKYSKPVVVYKTNGDYVGEFPSVIESARQLNLNNGNVSSVVTGRYKSSKGYVIKYKT